MARRVSGGRAFGICSLFLAGSALASIAGAGIAPLAIAVSHDLEESRAAETVEVPWAAIAGHFPQPMMDRLRVRRVADGAPIPSQVINFAATEGGPGARSLIFQHSFAAGERSAAFVVEFSESPVPPYPARVFARYVPERFDDFAWENDKLAHRAYGPALAAPAPSGSDKEVLVSSGMDVWCKRVDYPVIDRWYLKDHDTFDYHQDSGEGLDAYSVGRSRGVGGTGIWDGRRLHVSGNWTSWRVLANGPIRAVFELRYDAWDAAAARISEVKRFTVDAGRQLDEVDSTFTVEGDATGLSVAIGIARHVDVPAELTVSRDSGWLACWERYATNGELGTAIVLGPGQRPDFAEDSANHLLLAKLASGQSLRYHVGAAWALRGEITSPAEWSAHLTNFARRLRAPVRVSTSPVP